MNQFTSLWTPSILSRFHNFDDALVRDVHLVIGPSRDSRSATIALEARDSESDADEGWGQVVLKVRGVTEYRFVENGRESSYVVSLGLKVKSFGGVYFFDFGPDSDEPDGVDDFRRSSFYLAGHDCTWVVKPYPKSWMPRVRNARAARD